MSIPEQSRFFGLILLYHFGDHRARNGSDLWGFLDEFVPNVHGFFVSQRRRQIGIVSVAQGAPILGDDVVGGFFQARMENGIGLFGVPVGDGQCRPIPCHERIRRIEPIYCAIALARGDNRIDIDDFADQLGRRRTGRHATASRFVVGNFCNRGAILIRRFLRFIYFNRNHPRQNRRVIV